MSEFPFSTDNILEQCGGNADIGIAVLDEFLNQVPTDQAEMQNGLDNNELITTSKAAHRMKGTAGVLGADNLRSICAALEISAKEGNHDDANKLFQELKSELTRCVDYVQTAQQKLKG
ncbi:MAG: Hpt domain-containing protein [Planctomycetaceae bacterium]|jgi:HPt (histidine-containing phosphotransfer) domain-containing protein|nr:Hpt domain-containing protein [Planctomycetaceae bacterium]